MSNKKALLKLAVLSIDESIRNNPDRYASLISNHNDNSCYSSLATVASDTGQYYVPDDLHISQNHRVEMLLEEAEKLYNSLAELFAREVVNENVAKQSTETTSSSLPALPFDEEGGTNDDKQN